LVSYDNEGDCGIAFPAAEITPEAQMKLPPTPSIFILPFIIQARNAKFSVAALLNAKRIESLYKTLWSS
jgi:hypothetical protein